MADVFRTVDLALLLENKYVVIIGSSVQRCMYKDLVCVLQQDQYLTDAHLRSKGEKSFCHDKLLEGGTFSQMTNGTNYREVRQYVTEYHRIKFYFITRCYSEYMEKILAELKDSAVKPDVIILNSCLWDITRYGNVFVESYRENLQKLMERLQDCLPDNCLVIWNSTLPISKEAKGGVIIPECEAMTSTLRLDIHFANHLAAKIVQEAGYDVIDFQFYLRHQLHRRAEDGIHWDMTAHRRFTNLIMTHVAEAWGCELPNNSSMVNPSLLRTLQSAISEDIITPATKRTTSSRPIAKAKRRMPRTLSAFRNRNYGSQWQNQQRVTINQPDRHHNRPVRNNVVQDYNSNIFRNPGQQYQNQFKGPVHNSFVIDRPRQQNRRPMIHEVLQDYSSNILNNPVQHCRQLLDGAMRDGFVFDHQEQQNSEYDVEPQSNKQNINYNAAVHNWQSRFTGPVHNGFVLPSLEQQNCRPLINNFAERSWKPVRNNSLDFMQCSEKPVYNGPMKLFGDPHFHISVTVGPGPIFQEAIPSGPNNYEPQNFNNTGSFNDINYGENCDEIYQNQPVQQLGFLSGFPVGSNGDSIVHNAQRCISSMMIHTELNDENAGILQNKFSAFESHALKNSNRALKDKNIFTHQKQFRPFARRKNTAQRPAFLIAPHIQR